MTSITSLRTRKFFDVIQHHPSSPLKFIRLLPRAPYHRPEYWDRVYKDITPDDAHEWEGFDLNGGVLNFRYESVWHRGDCAEKWHDGKEGSEARSWTFSECMDVGQSSTPEEAIKRYDEQRASGEDETLLVLGCGSSRLGEQILMNSFAGPVIQLDVSSKIIQLMEMRYENYLSSSAFRRMEFIVDDARGLTSLSPGSVGGGVVDKGLIDSLHCSSGEIVDDDDERGPFFADGENQVREVVDSVHRVLRPSRPFVFFSRSGPEYILRRTLGTLHWDGEVRRRWKAVRVLKLVDLDVLLYRFVKADEKVGSPDDSRRIRIRRLDSKERTKR